MTERANTLSTILSDKRLLDASEVCLYLSLGRNKGIEFAKEIGSEVKVGRRCLYDRVKIDKYLDQLTEVEV